MERGVKCCVRCGRHQLLEHFHRDADARDGRKAYCRECASTRVQRQTSRPVLSSFGAPAPLRSATTPPALLMTGRSNSGRAFNNRLHRQDVQDIRRWAAREGWGQTPQEQARWLKAHRYPTLSVVTLVEVLANKTWFDPSYEPGAPDPEWFTLTPVSFLLVCLHLMRATMHNPTPAPKPKPKTERKFFRQSQQLLGVDQPLPAQSAEGVLDGAA